MAQIISLTYTFAGGDALDLTLPLFGTSLTVSTNWDFGGTNTTDTTLSHTYASSGTYIVVVTSYVLNLNICMWFICLFEAVYIIYKLFVFIQFG